MTQQELNKLPLNLKPAQAMEVLGLRAEGLATLRAAHPEMVVRKCGKGQYVYSKPIVLKLAGLKFE